ncbi:uncharacterized protein METZ01_LOCUS462600, partial [marine metagenome]
DLQNFRQPRLSLGQPRFSVVSG